MAVPPATWANLKHATATMDTLISVGVLSAWLWSLYALFLGDAGMPDMRMSFDLIPQQGGGADEIYLETASIVTTFVLAGRYFEARAKRRAGAAITALLELGAKDVAVIDSTAPSAACRSRSCSPATASWFAPARRSPRTVSSRRAPRRST